MKIQVKNKLVFLISFFIFFSFCLKLTAGTIESGSVKNDYYGEPSKLQNSGASQKKILKLIDNAIEYLGTAYIYGEATAKVGLDCSGLVMAAFSAADVKLPRTSRGQKTIGKKINFEDIRPGDLIFFYGRGFDSRRINHVGIYLGKGDFIHASQSEGKVAIDNLEQNRYYGQKVAEIRRIINE